jgi:hypothetical protein
MAPGLVLRMTSAGCSPAGANTPVNTPGAARAAAYRAKSRRT